MEVSCFSDSTPVLSNHAAVRSRQRGFRDRDVELVHQHGTAGDIGTVLTRRDAERRIADLKKEMAAIERLKGAAVVTDGDAVITLYHASEGRQRHMLRQSGRRCRRN